MTMNDYLLEGQGERAETGILLIHGLTGTPNEMRILARGLNNAGFTVYAVQLAGHCGTMDDLLHSDWEQWLESVRAGADRLALRVNKLIVGGLSMGSVLALALAEEHPEKIEGVMALSTTFRHDGWSMPKYTRMSFILPLMRALGIGRKKMFLEQPPYGIKDAALRSRIVSKMQAGESAEAGLPGNPLWSVVEMLALSSHVLKNLDRVRAPCLVIHASEDDIASVDNALRIVRGVCHASVQLVLLEDSYHMITIDRERRKVIECCINFAIEISVAGFNAPVMPGHRPTFHKPSETCI